MRRYDLEVTTTGTMSVEAGNAREARDAVLVALAGADLALASGPSSGLMMTGVRVSPDVALLRVDGVDPFAALAQALRKFGKRDG